MPTTSLRPALAALAAAPSATTVRKLWKALTSEERTAAITAAMVDDENGWVKATTRTAVAGAIKFRPQTVATWPKQKLVAEAARVPIEDVQLLSAFLVDLHLGTRRPMMAAFLDGVGVKHDDGRIDTEATGPIEVTSERLRAAADDLASRFPLDEVVTYFLTLLLQDAQTWSGVIGWLESVGA
ncbi:MAG: hypothetical protein DMD35_00835 [Gemmatimonadetes bacterium]|nr:MAG: hypothetical protein DMD35_00835 [Gemmatimonadota bacterium]